MDDTRLSSSVTVRRYRELELAEDRAALARFVVERFEERYLDPVEHSVRKHGFAILAVCCLAIEALESFRQGLADTKRASTKMFRNFFERDTPLKVFGSSDHWFYYDIRCGILHQAEARSGWRIRRRGPLLDRDTRTINATKFLDEVRSAIAAYAKELETSNESWTKFKIKMVSVVSNCTNESLKPRPR